MKKLFSLIICISVLVMSMSGLNLTAFAALSGKGTEDNPYIITTADEFKGISWAENTYYLITNDIDLTSSYTPKNFNGHLKGAVKADGSKYKVAVSIDSTDTYIGVFPSILGGTIENLEFAGTINFSGQNAMYIGGIIGRVYSGTPIIKNCVSSINIAGTGTHQSASVGGIVGCPSSGTIIECENKGTINVNVTLGAGGISGNTNKGNTITNCTNSGSITNNTGYAGGIMGRCYTGDKISGCVNTGNVTSKGVYTAGIIGYMYDGTVENCINQGTVTYDSSDEPSNTSYIGGIVGYINTGVVTGCSNSATINTKATNTTKIYAGGIAGCNSGNISKSSNTADFTDIRQCGGIVGNHAKGSIAFCYNTGDLPNSIGYKGGIAAAATGTISNCFNIGNAQGTHSGGIAGAFNNGSTISNVYTVVSESSNNSMTNTNNGTLTNAYYVIKDGGSVTGTATGTQVTFDELIKNITVFSDVNGWQVLAISDTNKYPLPQLKDNPYYVVFSICRAEDNVVITTTPVTQIPDIVEEGNEYTIKGHEGDYTIKAGTRYAAIFSKVNEYYGWGIKEYGVEVGGVQYPSKLSLTSDLSYGIVLENTPEEITVKSYAVYYEINNPDNEITVYSNVE